MTPDQLDHLIGHTDHRPLTPIEHAALRSAVAVLRSRAVSATTTVVGGNFHAQVIRQRDEARADAKAAERARQDCYDTLVRVERQRCDALLDANAQRARAEQAEARIAAVRALHERYVDRCGECYNPDYPEPWPCPTNSALDGNQPNASAPVRVEINGVPLTGVTSVTPDPEPPADEPEPTDSTSWGTATGRYRNEPAAVRELVRVWAIEDAITAIATRITRTEPAQEITLHPATLGLIRDTADRSGRCPIPIGPIGRYAGMPVICDTSVPVGEVRVQPQQEAAASRFPSNPHWTDALLAAAPALAEQKASTTLPHEPGRQPDCPACSERADIPYPYECPGHPTGQLTGDEVAALLHANRAHPGWEYATTRGPRKHWDDEDLPPCDGAEPDYSWERNIQAGSSLGWERFDYHEEAYWRRPLPAPAENVPTPDQP